MKIQEKLGLKANLVNKYTLKFQSNILEQYYYKLAHKEVLHFL